jgi:regulator of PEP synthase PpsR (kinase-PPPase family)
MNQKYGGYKAESYPPVYVVSGGNGASGEQLVETVLVQFPDFQIPIIKMTHIRQREKIKEIVAKTLETNGTIVHTLVDKDLRDFLIYHGNEKNVAMIDLMGPLFERLIQLLGQRPKEQPGLYRRLRQSYFDRVEAIEFTMNHDDGKNHQGLLQADLVLTGVSRSGKTPLSMFLAVLGWKVANVPIIPDSPIPRELFQIDNHRVFGLDIDFERLLVHRRKREETMRLNSTSDYTNPRAVFEEIEAAKKIFKKHGFAVIQVTDKAIETSAGELIDRVTRHFGGKSFTE